MNSTLTSKGQVTIPKAIRDYLGVAPGSRVEFAISTDGRALVSAVKPTHRRTGSSRAARLRGILNSGQGTDALMEMLRDYAADAHDPGFGGSRNR